MSPKQGGAEEKLRENEERYRAIFENTHDLIQSVDPDGGFIFVNPAWLKTLGYGPEELPSLRISDVIHERSRDHFLPLFEKALAGEEQEFFKATFRAKDGHPVEVEGSLTAFRDNWRGGATYAILRDVTERRKLEDRLYRVQQDWKDAFDTITDMITVHDRDFNIIHANRAAEKILGLPLLGTAGVKCFRYYHGTECPPQGCPSCETFRTGVPSTQQLYEPHLQRFLEIRAIPRFDREGRLIGLIHVVRDISDEKKAEEALRESERQYRLLFQSNPLPLWVYNRETLAFLAVNEAALQLYGFSREEFLALSVIAVQPPANTPDLRIGIEEHPAGLLHSGVRRQRRKDGSPIFVDIVSHSMTFDGREAILVLANDITEQKKLEEQLRHAQKMEAVGQLAGGVAHDFNNILSVIMTYTSLLQMKMPPDSNLGGYVDHILQSSERAANLTKSLLMFSRKQLYQPQPVDLNEVIRNIAKLLRRVLGEEIQMLTALCGGPLVVRADGGQVEQVIMNLSTNARDAMPQGGSLTIRTEERELGSEFIREHGFGKDGSYAVISVTDTGVGMDEATRLRIFEPFFTTKEVGRGTGLGLAIIYGIVKQHEGFITVRSRPGAGSTFTIFLPLIRETAAGAAPAVSQTPVGGTECVLLAEDEDEVRRIVSAVLQDYGYQVIEAEDGETAVRKFAENPDRVHLLLTDMIMPKKSGKSAAEEMRRIRPDLPVIFTSGYTADLLEQKGIASGEINFIAKPVSPFTLLRKIREILDKR